MRLGTLDARPASEAPELLAAPVRAALDGLASAQRAQIALAEIDPALADTAAFCERYAVRLDQSANCVVLAARREGRAWFAACVILATTRADVNGVVKKTLGASKLSFAAMDAAVEATGMEYGGITPLGLSADWPLLIDERVTAAGDVVIGSGVRRSKLLLPGALLAQLPGAQVLAIAN
ncbi:MAG TPA: YbaK/EbsC family protein [Candidatus Sulfotelmatobacter sp.]|nr:YbaK/EbsC family protein [Candidatus Sulfotelmatobacter sp.]